MKTAAGQNAGSKAPNDVVKIADNLNFKKLFVNVLQNESALDKVKQQIEYKNNLCLIGKTTTKHKLLTKLIIELFQCPA